MYRNPTEALVKFLDYKHGEKWAIWEFRAEGTGYPDSEVYNRIRHYPWPDHHPPPFALIPNMMASMRDWLKGPDAEKERVVVVHCKAGKGRSGTVATSYLISEEGWSIEDAMLRFTARRMRNGFGAGISIPSQVRWVGYTDWWTKHGKVYVERQIEILEVHVWGLRDGVKVAVEGYVEEGRVIKTFHTFSRYEKTVMDDPSPDPLSPIIESPSSIARGLPINESKPQANTSESPTTASVSSSKSLHTQLSHEPGAAAALFRPAQPLILPSSDINVDFERRNKAKYGLTMVTSVAHVWFNAFFESQYALQQSNSNITTSNSIVQPQLLDPTNPPTSGVFSIHWDAMDGIKGSARKGTRALDRLSIVWRVAPSKPPDSTTEAHQPPKIITQPIPGEPIPESGPSNRNEFSHFSLSETPQSRNLGLRDETPTDTDISRASSPAVSVEGKEVDDDDSEKGVKAHGPDGEDFVPHVKDDSKKDGGTILGLKETTDQTGTEGLPESKQKFPGQLTNE